MRCACSGSGCSGVGLRLVRRYGVFSGLRLLRRRLKQCSEVAQHAQALHRHHHRPPIAQRGECDPGCDVGCISNECWPDLGGGSGDGTARQPDPIRQLLWMVFLVALLAVLTIGPLIWVAK